MYLGAGPQALSIVQKQMENLRPELNDCRVSETRFLSKPNLKLKSLTINSSNREYFIAIDTHLF